MEQESTRESAFQAFTSWVSMLLIVVLIGGMLWAHHSNIVARVLFIVMAVVLLWPTCQSFAQYWRLRQKK